MKKILAMLLALVMVFGLAACGGANTEQPSSDPAPSASTPAAPSASNEPSAPAYEDMGTIMWLSNLTSGAQYDAAVAYLTAICDALGYEFTVIYGDAFNDASGNLLAVQNAMSDDVVGLIVSQDGGIGAIMEEFPELWVAGYNTDMRSVYGGGENGGQEGGNASGGDNGGEDMPTDCDYVLNTNSKKFHLPGKSCANSISDKNREEFFGTREELIEDGYEPCKICKP